MYRILLFFYTLLLFFATKAGICLTDSEYTMGPGDIIKISIPEDQTLSFESIKIDRDGTIKLGYAGKISMDGYTFEKAEQHLKALLEKDFLKQASVSLEIVVYGSKKIKLYGEVTTPGTYALKGKTLILEGLALGGGRTSKGSEIILIVRNYGTLSPLAIIQNHVKETTSLSRKKGKKGGKGEKEKPEYTLLEVDTSSLHKKGKDIYLQKGDFVFVQPAIQITVTGAAATEGIYSFSKKTDVVQLFAKTGGFKSSAKKNKIRIKRTIDGKPKTFIVDYNSFIEDNAKPFYLKDGDVIVVPESFF